MIIVEEIKEAVWDALDDGYTEDDILAAVNEAIAEGSPNDEQDRPQPKREKKSPRVSTPELGRRKANNEPLHQPSLDISDRWYPR